MTLKLRIVGDISPEELQGLVEESIHTVAGEDNELWETLPRLGERCLIVQSPNEELTVVSFDATNANRALVEGLTCMEQLNHRLAPLFLVDYVKPSRLIVLAPEPPPGVETLRACGFVESKTFKVIEANGERGLLFEGTDQGYRASVTAPRFGTERGRADETNVTTLSGEEEQFFEQLPQ